MGKACAKGHRFRGQRRESESDSARLCIVILAIQVLTVFVIGVRDNAFACSKVVTKMVAKKQISIMPS
jgi:hypothetical protein